MKYLCQVPERGLSCVGCCKIDVHNKIDDLIVEIEENTQEYTQFKKENSQIQKYFNRGENIDRESGLCSLLIFLDDTKKRVGCPAHPFMNDGIDYRKMFNICYAQYDCCEATKSFRRLEEEGQGRALGILEKRYAGDWIGFSMDMEKGRTMEIFDRIRI